MHFQTIIHGFVKAAYCGMYGASGHEIHNKYAKQLLTSTYALLILHVCHDGTESP